MIKYPTPMQNDTRRDQKRERAARRHRIWKKKRFLFHFIEIQPWISINRLAWSGKTRWTRFYTNEYSLFSFSAVFFCFVLTFCILHTYCPISLKSINLFLHYFFLVDVQDNNVQCLHERIRENWISYSTEKHHDVSNVHVNL